MLYCSVSFVAGIVVFWVLFKILGVFNQQAAQTRAELDQVRQSFEKYQDQVTAHMAQANHFVEEIQQKMGHLQSHLFSSPQLINPSLALGSEEVRADYAVAKAVLDQAQSAEFSRNHYLNKDA